MSSSSLTRPCWRIMRAVSNQVAKHPSTQQSRHMAIMPTVKVASDTSAIEFPAPSHVSLSTQLAEIAESLNGFYSDPKSTIEIPEEVKLELKDEVERKTKSVIAEMESTDISAGSMQIPDTIKLSENPLFEAYEKSRSS